MLEPRGSRLGDFDFTTRQLEEDEKKFYGIFISHANADNEDCLYPLRNAMLEMGLYPLCDRDFLSGGDDFQSKIERTLDCYAAVIIITEASLHSHWVNYEIGILSGKNIPVYLWDPNGILNTAPKEDSVDFRKFADAHLNRFLPAFNSLESLLDAIRDLSPYADMFCEENAYLDCTTFRKRMKEYAETVIVTLESNIFDEYYSDFAECKIGTLIPNFGMFYADHGDGEHCYARNRCVPLEDRACPQNGIPCALSLPRTLGEENKECVLLNHVMYNGKVYRQGDLNRQGKRIEKGCIMFHVPVHKLYGTEFKFIMDVQDNTRYDLIMALLEKAGMNPSASNSMLGGRIYLSLPERRMQGLFRLNHEFTNNFLCPHAARKSV
ncbi:MAG: hypothetical protein E7480_05735 [Ruminococcaceae bacterium]|nr:hypothetical protein [Oscillospiraceae bacterium]